MSAINLTIITSKLLNRNKADNQYKSEVMAS